MVAEKIKNKPEAQKCKHKRQLKTLYVVHCPSTEAWTCLRVELELIWHTSAIVWLGSGLGTEAAKRGKGEGGYKGNGRKGREEEGIGRTKGKERQMK